MATSEIANETAAVAAVAVAVAVTTEGEKQSQKLERKWTFWYDNQSKPKQGAAWGTSLRNVYTFDTVQDFWCLYDQIFRPSKLPSNADFHLFKTGIEPKWEDPECANGGKWSVTCNRKASLDTMWLETVNNSIVVLVKKGYMLLKNAHVIIIMVRCSIGMVRIRSF